MTCQVSKSSSTSKIRGEHEQTASKTLTHRAEKGALQPSPKVGIYSASPSFHFPLTLSLQSKISVKLDISLTWRSGSWTAGESEVSETGKVFANKVHLDAWLILTCDKGALKEEGCLGFMLGSPGGARGFRTGLDPWVVMFPVNSIEAQRINNEPRLSQEKFYMKVAKTHCSSQSLTKAFRTDFAFYSIFFHPNS